MPSGNWERTLTNLGDENAKHVILRLHKEVFECFSQEKVQTIRKLLQYVNPVVIENNLCKPEVFRKFKSNPEK